MKKIEHEHLIHLEEIYETSKVCKMFNVKSAYFAFRCYLCGPSSGGDIFFCLYSIHVIVFSGLVDLWVIIR